MKNLAWLSIPFVLLAFAITAQPAHAQSYYTCTLSVDTNHVFDFGFVTTSRQLYWSTTISTPVRLEGIIAEFDARWTNGGKIKLQTNDIRLLYLQLSGATGVTTRTNEYCADALYDHLPTTHNACNAIGPFPAVNTMYIADLGGPGNLNIGFTGVAEPIAGVTSPGYMQVSMRNLRAIYYGSPGGGCDQTTQPTPTPTPTGLPTSTPPPTPTPGASPTPWTTPTSVPTPCADCYNFSPFALNLGDIQGAIDVVTSTSQNVDLIVNTIDTRTDVNVLKIRGWSPFAFARAILMILEDFEWLSILFWWFVSAFCVIMAVTAIRLLVSLWGVIERVISLIKLIPFIGLLVFVVFAAQPAHAQTATPPPTPTATPIPSYIVNDYHFIYPQMQLTDTQWTPAGGASWSFSKWTVPVTGSISQYVDPVALAGSHPFTVSVRAQASITSTFGVTAGGVQHTFTITRVGRLARTYTYSATFNLPTSVTVATIGGGPVVFDSVGLEAQDLWTSSEWVAGAWEHPMVKPHSLDLASLTDWFIPIDLHPTFTWDITSSDWFVYFTTIVGPVAATMMQFMTPRVIHMYIAFRILLMAVLWFIGFVMEKIGKPIPPASGAHTISIGGANFGSTRYNWTGLPKLPPSGIRRGRGKFGF